MGVVCDCNLNTSRPIVFKKQEIAIDITNNNTEIENKISEFTKLKLYFQSNENNKLSTQRSKKETQYDLIIRRLLEEDQPKKKHPRRKLTINPSTNKQIFPAIEVNSVGRKNSLNLLLSNS